MTKHKSKDENKEEGEELLLSTSIGFTGIKDVHSISRTIDHYDGT